jgi:hypothetical protein
MQDILDLEDIQRKQNLIFHNEQMYPQKFKKKKNISIHAICFIG